MKNKLRRMLQKLEELQLLNWRAAVDEEQPVKQLSFIFQGTEYQIQHIFENCYYADELNDEVVEYHFYSKHKNCSFELIFDSLEKCFFIQSLDKCVLNIFSQNTFEKSGNNTFTRVATNQISFLIDNKEVIYDEIKLNRDGTPADYSEQRYAVYFAIGGKDKDLINIDKMLSLIGFIEKEQISEEKHGFNLHIPIQQIPEVIKILVIEKWAIYEVCYEK